jgi:hypothetical protein
MRVLPLVALVAVAAAPAVKPEADGPQPVVVAVAAGPLKDVARRVLLKPYADATGTSLGDAAWDGSPDGLKTIGAAHGFDLAVLDDPALSCRRRRLSHGRY